MGKTVADFYNYGKRHANVKSSARRAGAGFYGVVPGTDGKPGKLPETVKDIQGYCL